MTTPLPAQNHPESGDVLPNLPPDINNLTQAQLTDLLRELGKVTQEIQLTQEQFERLRQHIDMLKQQNAELKLIAKEIPWMQLKISQLKQENHRLKQTA